MSRLYDRIVGEIQKDKLEWTGFHQPIVVEAKRNFIKAMMNARRL